MDDLSRAFYELRYENQFLKLKGNGFQDFFADIMGKRYPGDFVRVKPWGKRGDQKNDGYLKSERTLFQVYAPNEMSEKKMLDKVTEDFEGALPYWEEYFDRWVFVHNAKDGLGPEQAKILLKLDKEHDYICVTSWGFDEIRQRLFELEGTDIMALLGYVPSRYDVINLRVEQVRAVLDSLPRVSPPYDIEIRAVRGDKIKKNELSGSVCCLLKAGMEGAEKVRWFFRNNRDKTLGDRIAESFKEEYLRLRDEGLGPNEIFSKLHEFTGGTWRGTPQHEASVLAILAYFFEQCDIFEEP